MFDYSENTRTDGIGHLEEIMRLMKIKEWAVQTERHQLAASIDERVQEMPLSVTVREGWKLPGSTSAPEEFEILLGTGGPAVRLYGTLDAWCYPDEVQLQNQDWGTPWQRVCTKGLKWSYAEIHDALRDFAGTFYFGE